MGDVVHIQLEFTQTIKLRIRVQGTENPGIGPAQGVGRHLEHFLKIKFLPQIPLFQELN
jgi:hypothetical protein